MRGRPASSSPGILQGRRSPLRLELRFDDGARPSSTSRTSWNRVATATGSSASSLWLVARRVAPARARRPRGHRAPGDERRAIARPRSTTSTPSSACSPACRRRWPFALVFDHNLGGGANQYRRRLIDERLAGGIAVLLCTYNLPTLDYRLAGVPAGRRRGDLPDLVVSRSRADARRSARVEEIFLNSPVSFDEPLVFADWISAMRAGNPERG